VPDEPEQDGQIHTLGLLEQLRGDLRSLGSANSELYHRVDNALRELAKSVGRIVNPSAFAVLRKRRARGAATTSWPTPTTPHSLAVGTADWCEERSR
jgi:hypothetical protein